MKKAIGVLILIAIFLSCKKEKSGTLNFKMEYSSSQNKTVPSSKSEKDFVGYYNDIGDYITSITPHLFIGKFGMMGFQESYNNQDNTNHVLLFVEGNIPDDAPIRFADFTNNAIVNYTPSGLTNDHGLYDAEEITLNYFYFHLDHFYQEVNLPQQYDTIDIAMFHRVYANYHYIYDSVKVNNVLKIKHFPFTDHLSNPTSGYPSAFVFGNCDSTFLFNTEGNAITNSAHWPFGGSTINPIIRSNKYSPITLITPGAGETKEMIGYVSFDLLNLIQIYAGDDNIPYTSDDVFIYAPNFWERIIVNVVIE